MAQLPIGTIQTSLWSDGGSRVHDITWSESSYSFTAYFRKKAVKQYTLTLNRNPSNGGTVSGGGTYNAGTSVRVSASPNSGWRFVRWSDGMGQSHNVTMNANKSLTAYFEKYTLTSEEIFSGTALTSSSYWNAYGGASVSVSSGVTTLRMLSIVSDSAYVMFNRGYLGSKIEQGHIYMLSFQIKSSVSNTVVTAGIGRWYNNGLDYVSSDGIIYGELNGGIISTSYKTINLRFTADKRDATTSDGFIIAAAESCTLSIKSLSLKEI
jgi:hypothetical protein